MNTRVQQSCAHAQLKNAHATFMFAKLYRYHVTALWKTNKKSEDGHLLHEHCDPLDTRHISHITTLFGCFEFPAKYD